MTLVELLTLVFLGSTVLTIVHAVWAMVADPYWNNRVAACYLGISAFTGMALLWRH